VNKVGRAFYKGYATEILQPGLGDTDSARYSGFEPKMTRREASLILELSYVLCYAFFMEWTTNA
jgi:hypothetical protein